MGTSRLNDSSAAFLFEVPGSNSPLVVQELQIGGTSAVGRILHLLPHAGGHGKLGCLRCLQKIGRPRGAVQKPDRIQTISLHPDRMILTVSFVLFLVSGLFCRHRRFGSSVEMPGRRDFAVRLERSSSEVAFSGIKEFERKSSFAGDLSDERPTLARQAMVNVSLT